MYRNTSTPADDNGQGDGGDILAGVDQQSPGMVEPQLAPIVGGWLLSIGDELAMPLLRPLLKQY